MTDENHNKLIAWFFIGIGGFGIFNLLTTMLIFALNWKEYEKLFDLFRKDLNFPIETFVYLFGLLLLFSIVLAILQILAGWGMMQRSKLGRIGAIAIGAVSLIGIPFGTALGVYTLWFLTSDRGKNYYNV